VLAIAYVPGLLCYLVLLRDGAGTSGRGGLEAVLFLFAITWACDTFAYVVGRAIGRRPLWPAISPNKTVEGAVGGTLAAILAASGAQRIILGDVSLGGAAVAGLVLGAVLQAGDLFESRLKRRAGVKDSSALLPGHGGLLDRFDSMLFGAPAAFYLLRVLL
jgi:phosphatidate cytidylyltransferase